MQDIKTIKDLSNAVHELRDACAVELAKLHNQYWKGVDPEDEEQVKEVCKILLPLLIEVILKYLEKIVALVLKVLHKLYKIDNEKVLNLEDLMYSGDGKKLVERLINYYLEHKGQNAVYNLTRLIDTESEYVFSGVMQDKIPPDEYPYFIVDNLDYRDHDECGCPDPGTIFPASAEHPPYHPECECFWEPLTQEEFEKITS